MKYILLIISLFNSSNLFSQKINLDSLNKYIKIGICKGESDTCIKMQIDYIKNCEKIGDYYYNLKKYKVALKYYLLVSDLGTYTDGELQSENTIELRNKIAAKAGDIYYYGLDVKKNRIKAFYQYYRLPVFYSDEEKAKYSRLLFNNTKYYYEPIKKIKKQNIISFGINPFYLKDTSTASNLRNKLDLIQSDMTKRNTLRCEIVITYGMLFPGQVSQAYLNLLLDNLKKFIKSDLIERFSFNVIISEKGYKYKEYILPELIIKLIN